MIKLNHEPDLQEYIMAGRTFRVLIIDDSKTIRTVIKTKLETRKFEIIEACCGKDAIKSIRDKVPDIILLDVVMPDLDGMSVLKILRKTYSKLQLPIIMISSGETSSEIVKALEFGANDYITKPVDLDILCARVNSLLLQKMSGEYLYSAKAGLERQFKCRTEELSSTNQKLSDEIQERLLIEDRLKKQASYDSLTGLPNRSLATDRLKHTLIKAKRRDLKPCVTFLDLDNFKYVNDTLGHAAGDELLREAAKRLTECSRESDTVARLGGDEFLLILDDDEQHTPEMREQGLRLVGERIIESFSKPFEIEGHEVNITPSLGFAIYPKDGEDGNQLMRHADAAMYRSKHDGKNTFCFFSPAMTVMAKMHMNIESQLQHALEREEFSIHYQPIVNAVSGELVKVEALLRWNSAELGMISPDCFIPMAEATGLIVPIGEWVMRQACKQVKIWRDSGWADISVTVNVSACQFQSQTCLVEIVKQSLETNDLPSSALQIELTERTMIRESSHTLSVMRALEELGIKLFIDDFGTGYASLSYLQRYHFDAIKIDRSYINNVLVSEQDAGLVKAVIAMADSLGMPVIFEGVESKGQLEFLLENNCKFAQGYYFSKPLPVDECEEMFAKLHTTLPAQQPLGLVSSGTRG